MFNYSNDLLIKASRWLALSATVLVCIWNLREESTMIPKSLTDSVGVISLPLMILSIEVDGTQMQKVTLADIKIKQPSF